MSDQNAPTRWSRIQARDFDYFVERFWSPVHRFMRARMPSVQDAEELTQELFLAFLQRDLLARADADRGSFRSFLFHCARQFLIDRYRAANAAKRGGGRLVSLEQLEQGLSDQGLTAEQAFDREWYLSLINHARRGVKAQCQAQGQEVAYRAFRLFYFGDTEPEPWSQKRVAEHLGLPVSQVNNYVYRTRQVFGRELRAAMAEYSSSEEELDHELSQLSQFLDGHGLAGNPSSTLFEAPAE
jgi:RNA polymerase sigma factor (sigma-70 family)